MFHFVDGLASLLGMNSVPFWAIVVKSTIAIGLAAIACKLLHRQSAAVRHRVWVCGLAASLVVLMTSLLLPQVTLAVLPNGVDTSSLASTDGVGSTVMNVDEAADESDERSFVPKPARDTESIAMVEADALMTPNESEASPPVAAVRFPIEQALVACWLLGTLVSTSLFLLSLAIQSMKLRRLPRVDDKEWCDAVAAAAKTLGLKRPVITLESDDACVPAVAGVFSPQLLVPSDWRSWSPTQRQCILLHELAHVKRYDISTQLLGRLALLAYWFNPLVWHAVRQLRSERELASDDCVLLAGQAASDYAEQLLHTLECYRPVRPAVGVAMAHSGRLDHRVRAILDPQRRRDPVGVRFAIVLACTVALMCVVVGGVTLSTNVAVANQPSESNDDDAGDKPKADEKKNAMRVWKKNYTIEYPSALPVSVVFSADGKTLLTGDTNGELMALVVEGDNAAWRWKANVGGSHAAVAFSADQKHVYATMKDGVRVLDAERGKKKARIEEKGANAIAIGVFPEKKINAEVSYSQIVFSNARGSFIKTWVDSKLPATSGTIQTTTVVEGIEPPDAAAVPLAVDPKGRSAIMTGPIDGTGKVAGAKGKNVLWAYVCGDYSEGSPGNRVMVGHVSTVVSAAWSKEGSTAVTGDVDGRVITWDAKTMKETSRLELGGRVAALAISDDGSRTAAFVLGKQGRVLVWDTSKPAKEMTPIHTDVSDFGGPTSFASLSFAPGGDRLAGCAGDKRWLTRLGELIGKVHVWELAAEPRAQLPPKHAFTKTLPPGTRPHFVFYSNDSILMPADKEGAIDFRDIEDGSIQQRLRIGKFTIGGMKLSADRRWLVLEQHAPVPPPNVLLVPTREFDVGVWDLKELKQKATITSCGRTLDIGPSGKAIAVVREKRIEVWDVATSKLASAAPFKYKSIDAAAFSPDGELLAISDQNTLVLWNWKANTHDRIDLGRRVGSLAFSPDGRYLAEGPAPRGNLQIRDVTTRKVVQTLTNDIKQSMDVPSLTYTQSGRVLIACNNITLVKEIPVPHRIHLWDTADGSLAHSLAITSGLPLSIDVTPNGRYLIALIEDDKNNTLTLSGWRLDGETREKPTGPTPPATTRP